MTTTASVHSESEVAPASDGASPSFDMHGPNSLSIRAWGDLLSWFMTGRIFVLQVAHPAVGAGVWEHSAFRQDPWRRLREIQRSGRNFALRGREASREEGARLRYLHRNIAGVDSHGRKYHALEPHVYGWVNMVFLDSIVTMHALYGVPLTRAQEEQAFAEWRQGGRTFGLKERDLPATLDAYWERYNDAVENELEYNPAVAQLLSRSLPPKPPELKRIPDALWPALWKPLSALSYTFTLAGLPPKYRAKLAEHHPWTERDERRMERFRRLVRNVVPRLPDRLRYSGETRRALAAAGS